MKEKCNMDVRLKTAEMLLSLVKGDSTDEHNKMIEEYFEIHYGGFNEFQSSTLLMANEILGDKNNQPN